MLKDSCGAAFKVIFILPQLAQSVKRFAKDFFTFFTNKPLCRTPKSVFLPALLENFIKILTSNKYSINIINDD